MNNRFQKLRILLILLLAAILIVQGCSSSEPMNNEEAAAPTNTASVSEPEAAEPAAPEQEEAAPASTEPLDTETLSNTTGKTLIRSFSKNKEPQYNASIAIVSESGTTIIADPFAIPRDNGLVKTDIITVSHSHRDHYDTIFVTKANLAGVKASYHKEDQFTEKDVTVTGIPASHTSEAINLERPSNVLYVYEVDGMRIAHLGDLGQDELHADQLEKLGTIDILFTRFSNVADFGASTDKTIKVLEQVKPKIVVPTHYEPEAVDVILEAAGITDRSEADELAITKDELAEITETKYVFLK